MENVQNYIVITRTQHPSKTCLKRISKTLSMSLKKLETHFWRHRNTIHISCEKCNGYLGAEQYSSYKERVFVFGSKSTYETIKRNKFSLYKNTNTVVISKTQKKVASLKQDCQLYSNFYAAHDELCSWRSCLASIIVNLWWNAFNW